MRYNKPVELIPSVRRKDLHEGEFDLDGILRGDQTEQVTDAGYVRVDRQTGNVKAIAEYAVGSLAANTGESDQFFERLRNLAAELIDQLTAALLNVPRLVLVEPS